MVLPGTSPKKELCLRSEFILCAYVQIPFCRSLCNFCCWCKNYNPSEILSIKKWKGPYLEALKREIRARSKVDEEKKRVNLEVIHFGGGTPSLLTTEELHATLSTLLSSYDQKREDITTIGIEVRPDDITLKKAKRLKSIGFNRISMGVESFDPSVLRSLQRHIPVEQSFRAYEWIREAGFEEINIDLLYGFPFQSLEQLKQDVETVIRLAPEHIDAHPWKPVSDPLCEPASKNYEEEKAKKIEATSYLHRRLQEEGYLNYNHRCFCKPGGENLMHMIEATYSLPFIAFGAGCEQYRRPKTTTGIRKYVNAPFSTDMFQPVPEHSTQAELLFLIDTMIRQLLLPEGIHVPHFNRRYNCDVEKMIALYKKRENLEKELNRYANKLLFTVELSRIQIFRKIINWIETGVIETQGDYLQLADRHRISHETWVLYMQAC